MEYIKHRIFEVIQIGKDQDKSSIAFDFFIASVILVNLFVTLFETFDISEPYLPILDQIDLVTTLIFAAEYGLRLWTAEYLYPRKSVIGVKIPLAPGLILAVICQGNRNLVPRGNTVLHAGDKLVLGAEGFKDEIGIKLKEIVLRERHPWAGKMIKELDISR